MAIMVSISKNRICRNVFMLICFSLTIFLAACGSNIDLYETETEQNMPEDRYEVGKEEAGEENREADEEAEKENCIIPYNVPLNEIAEKIEYIYTYQNMIYDISFYDYGELGSLPEGKNVRMSVYTLKGNKLLFLPEEKENTEAIVNGELCGLYYSEERNGYMFYIIMDYLVDEGGVPVSFVGDNSVDRWFGSYTVKGEGKQADGTGHYYYELDEEGLTKLGEIEVTLDPQRRMELPAISIEGNEYVNAIVRSVKETLAEKGKFGDFEIYLGTYGRMFSDRNKYKEHLDTTIFKASGCVMGERVAQYFFYNIYDDWGIGVAKSSYYPPSYEEEDIYYFSGGKGIAVQNPEIRIRKVMNLGREKISFRVTEGEEYMVDTNGVDLYEKFPDYTADMDFARMGSAKAVEWLSYACSYSEWFGMNELGYPEGEVRGFKDKEIVMYTWPPGTKGNEGLYFLPMDKANDFVLGRFGKLYPIYVNEEGDAEFYYIERNPFAGKPGHLKTSLCFTEQMDKDSAGHLFMLGCSPLGMEELTSLDVPEVEKDEYVNAVEDHVRDLLEQDGKRGEYKVYIGEYEAMYATRVCISAAVVGEEEYYVRYLIVRSQKGNYYFWPVGFGLDGSLEECEAGRHYMNRLCIDRTKELERYVSVINVLGK